MNLLLYIPPASAHPPGVLKSTIYGNLRRYWLQNTNKADYHEAAKSFARHLIDRGHDSNHIKTLFLEAAHKLDNPRPRRITKPDTKIDQLFFHQQYHPQGLPKSLIRSAYKRFLGTHSGFKRLTIAYSRPKNLRDALMPSRLHTEDGANVSSYRTTPTGDPLR